VDAIVALLMSSTQSIRVLPIGDARMPDAFKLQAEVDGSTISSPRDQVRFDMAVDRERRRRSGIVTRRRLACSSRCRAASVGHDAMRPESIAREYFPSIDEAAPPGATVHEPFAGIGAGVPEHSAAAVAASSMY